MKNLTNIIALVALTLLVGCATTAEKNALTTVGTVGALADAAIGAYDTYSQNNPVPIEQVRQVRRAVQSYTLAISTARLAITSYKSGDLDKTALNRAIDALSASSAELVRLVSALTTPPTVNNLNLNS